MNTRQRGTPTRLALTALCVSALLAGCGAEPESGLAPSSATPSGIRFLADTGEDSASFSQALEPVPFEFPRDHLPHPDFRTEWWYFTGNLFDSNNDHFGFELTLFRIALTGANTEQSVSSFSSHQLWMGHFALTDTRRELFTALERISRGIDGVAGASASRGEPGTRLTIEDWSIEYNDETVKLHAGDQHNAIALDLTGLNRIVLQGDAGLDAKGPEPGNASYYFSAPRLSVSGEVLANGESRTVTGTAWMDREWSTSALSPDIAGWDWFALQLADGRDLMFYRLRGHDGSTSPFSGGTILNPDGSVTRLSANSVELEPLRVWASDETGITYPVAWQVNLPDHAMELQVLPRLDAQEIDLSVRYWEGAVQVNGNDKQQPVSGVGYLELAGY